MWKWMCTAGQQARNTPVYDPGSTQHGMQVGVASMWMVSTLTHMPMEEAACVLAWLQLTRRCIPMPALSFFL